MINFKNVYPECYADTLLIELIIKRPPSHLKGINNVALKLQRFQNNTIPVVGVIDKDKFTRIPEYIKSFQVIEEKHNLTLRRLENTKKFIIQLAPAFEQWIIEAGESCGQPFSESAYKGNFKLFKHDAKDDEVHNNASFKKFVNDIVSANPIHIKTLRFWLEMVFEE